MVSVRQRSRSRKHRPTYARFTMLSAQRVACFLLTAAHAFATLEA
jgi:hypothetical protein